MAKLTRTKSNEGMTAPAPTPTAGAVVDGIVVGTVTTAGTSPAEGSSSTEPSPVDGNGSGNPPPVATGTGGGVWTKMKQTTTHLMPNASNGHQRKISSSAQSIRAFANSLVHGSAHSAASSADGMLSPSDGGAVGGGGGGHEEPGVEYPASASAETSTTASDAHWTTGGDVDKMDVQDVLP